MATSEFPPATEEQKQAWRYYGMPTVPRPGARTSGAAVGHQVGEVRYIIGWMADQMVRMGWRVTINGSEKWSIVPPEGSEPIVSDPEESDTNAATHPTSASVRLLQSIEWDSRTVREVTTNLFVAGELHYALVGDRWRVVSVIRSDREDLLSRARLKVRGIWPHPADPEAPDAPIFGVLGVLDDMVWLNRLSRSQSANRAGMRGIIGVADQLQTAEGNGGEAFWADFEASLSRPMDDPQDTSPVGIRGPQELVEPSGSGMKGLSWIIPDFPYDDKIDERMHALVRRLAYGLPVPPEVLLGLQAQSKATAFQVEGSTYRAHIEPVALLVAKVATDALSMFLPDTLGSAEVHPDPTTILARRHSVADAFEAFDRGAVNFEYLREVLGIPKRAKLEDEDVALRVALLGRSERNERVEDPAETAAKEPISAAASLPESPRGDGLAPETSADEYLSELLQRIDNATLHELVGASAQAVAKARERIGGHLRSNPKLRDKIPQSVDNEGVLDALGGEACFEALGVKGEEIVNQALASTLRWWTKRLNKARGQVENVLGDAGIETRFSDTAAIESTEALRLVLYNAATNGGSVPEAQLRTVLEIAGRQE